MGVNWSDIERNLRSNIIREINETATEAVEDAKDTIEEMGAVDTGDLQRSIHYTIGGTAAGVIGFGGVYVPRDVSSGRFVSPY